MIWHDTIFVSFYSFFTTRFSITTSEITIALPKYKYLPFGSGLLICVMTVAGSAGMDTGFLK